MSYYSRSYHDNSSWWTMIICFALVFLIMFTHNACTAQEWNGGKCPDCNVRYELCSVYKGTYYYACPKCGNEVSRYGGK